MLIWFIFHSDELCQYLSKKPYISKSIRGVFTKGHMVCITYFKFIHLFPKCSMYRVCIINDLNYSTNNMYKTRDGILHTFTTNNYSMREMSTQVIVPGHVQHSLPILLEYYWGMYDSSSSSCSDESLSGTELPNLNKVASDSVPSTSPETSTSSIDD